MPQRPMPRRGSFSLAENRAHEAGWRRENCKCDCKCTRRNGKGFGGTCRDTDRRKALRHNTFTHTRGLEGMGSGALQNRVVSPEGGRKVRLLPFSARQ
jgi:hypothetical protein